MQRLINTVAMAAALMAVIVAIWENHGLWVALKRSVVSYLVFYFVASLLILVFRAGVMAEARSEDAEKKEGEPPAQAAGKPSAT